MPLGLLVSPCDLIFTSEIVCWSLQVLLNCPVKKALTAEKRATWQAEGEGCQQGARPSLLSSCQTRKRCSPLFEGDNRFALYGCVSLSCQAGDGEKSGSSAGTAMPAQVWRERALSSIVAKMLFGGWETCSGQRLRACRGSADTAERSSGCGLRAGGKAEVQHM